MSSKVNSVVFSFQFYISTIIILPNAHHIPYCDRISILHKYDYNFTAVISPPSAVYNFNST